jgi:hypothetical protein
MVCNGSKTDIRSSRIASGTTYPFEILRRGVASCVFRAAEFRAVLRLRPPLNQLVVNGVHQGVAEMPTYRLYCLDDGGQIGFADWIEANTDADAIAKARQVKRNGQKCEVWRGSELIGALDAHDLANEAPEATDGAVNAPVDRAASAASWTSLSDLRSA